MNYSNTYFYKIVCKNPDIKDCYVGHTTNFSNRKDFHRCMCGKENKIVLYDCMKENGGWLNWDMILIEKRTCENYLEARMIEREYIDKLTANLNQVKPYITDDERKITNNKTCVNYREKNRYELNKKKREKYECPCGGNYTRNHRRTHERTKKHQQYLQSVE